MIQIIIDIKIMLIDLTKAMRYGILIFRRRGYGYRGALRLPIAIRPRGARRSSHGADIR